jgi:hypothetical protein
LKKHKEKNGLVRLDRDSSGFQCLGSDGIYSIAPDFRATLENKSSFGTSIEQEGLAGNGNDIQAGNLPSSKLW